MVNKVHNNLKKFPITRTKWYHRTNEESWEKIKNEGVLWGGDIYHITGGKKGYRYTYLSSIDWGDSYGSVLLEIDYQVTGLRGIDNCRFEDDNIPHNNEVSQFSVFVPILLCKCERVCFSAK